MEEYDGEPAVFVAATQLDASRPVASRIVQEWCEFFASGASAILDLEFVTRTPKRLFASLRGQSQLERLALKWGDYDDLAALAPMRRLLELDLGGASGVTDLQPLAGLASLRRLRLEGTKRVHDYSPLGSLAQLEQLTVSEGLGGPRLHADTLGWVRGLRALRSLGFGVTVDDLDYSAVLDLGHVEHISIAPVKGMHPSLVDLEWASPGMQAAARFGMDTVTPFYDVDGTKSGEFRKDVDGRIRFHPTDDQT
ncbi:hypothetical protein [Amnibacterium endophyticum]|uniref:Leucine-rich repeat domain-containing protein n=1 Tax=Amnibacterium endophyticum TaxID=2109337 RepID=A0ABW4LJW3_9MICO